MFLSTKEAAALLGLEESTLRSYRSSEPPKGPNFYRYGGASTSPVRYEIQDLLEWARSHRIRVMPRKATVDRKEDFPLEPPPRSEPPFSDTSKKES